MHVSMRSLKHFKIGVGKHQSVQAYKLEGIQVSGHVITKVCKCGSTLSLWYMNLNACDQRSMLTKEHPIIKVSKHMSIKAYRQMDMFSSKHVDIGACDYHSM